MTVLVTGGSGFVGQAVIARLLNAGQLLRLAQRTKLSPALEARGVEHALIGDLSVPIDWSRALDGVDAVIHIAGLAHQPPGVSDVAMFKVNTEATARFANAAATAGVRSFIFMSSVRAMVGASSHEIITDETPPAPIDAYGRSKLEAELALKAMGIGGAILRPVLVVGAKATGNLALLRKLARLPVSLPLAGLSGRRSMISDRSLAEAVHHLLFSGPSSMTSYLAAHPESMTVGEIVATMREAQARRPALFSLPNIVLESAARVAGKSRMLERVSGDLVVRADRLAATGWQPVETTREALAR